MPEPTSLAAALVRIEQLERELARYKKKGAKTLCPERLSAAEFDYLQHWGDEHGYSNAQLFAAFERVHDWSHAGGHKRVTWWLVVKNGMSGDGWALKGAPPPTTDSSPKARQWESEAEVRRREQDECIDQWTDEQREAYFERHPGEILRYLGRHKDNSEVARIAPDVFSS